MFDGQKRRVVTAGSTLLVVVLLIQIADPLNYPTSAPDRIDSDNLTDILRNTIDRTVTLSHTEDISITREREDNNRSYSYVLQVKYEPADGQYSESASYENDLAADPDLFAYSSESSGWQSPPRHEWVPSTRDHLARRTLAEPEHLDAEQLTVVSQNGSSSTVEATGVNVTQVLNTAPYIVKCCWTTNVTFVVDSEEQVLRSVIVGNSSTPTVEYRCHSYGTTEVERPEGVPPVSIRGMVWDVTHGPLFEL